MGLSLILHFFNDIVVDSIASPLLLNFNGDTRIILPPPLRCITLDPSSSKSKTHDMPGVYLLLSSLLLLLSTLSDFFVSNNNSNNNDSNSSNCYD